MKEHEIATPGQVLNRAGAGMERVNAFSDGVFAIAITLLLLELRAPAADAVAASGGLWGALWGERFTFLALVVSFALMGIFWVGHHAMFQLVHRNDRPFLWWNLLLLFFMGTIPFSAVLLTTFLKDGDVESQRIALTVYSANLILAGAALDLLWRHASRGRRLVDAKLPENVIWMVHVRILTGPVFYAVAVAIGWFVGVPWALYFLVLTPLLYIFPTVFDRMEAWRTHLNDSRG